MRACLENKTVLKDCQICWKLRMGPHAAPITSYSQLKIPFSITKPSEKNFFFLLVLQLLSLIHSSLQCIGQQLGCTAMAECSSWHLQNDKKQVVQHLSSGDLTPTENKSLYQLAHISGMFQGDKGFQDKSGFTRNRAVLSNTRT